MFFGLVTVVGVHFLGSEAGLGATLGVGLGTNGVVNVFSSCCIDKLS